MLFAVIATMYIFIIFSTNNHIKTNFCTDILKLATLMNIFVRKVKRELGSRPHLRSSSRIFNSYRERFFLAQRYEGKTELRKEHLLAYIKFLI